MSNDQRAVSASYQKWRDEQAKLQSAYRTSEGYRYHYYRKQFGDAFDSWNDEHIELAELLDWYETDLRHVLALSNRVDTSESEALMRTLNRKILSCMASFWALKDQIPKSLGQVASPALVEEFARRESALNKENLVVPFMVRFRNYVQHHQTAPWRVRTHWRGGGSSWRGEILLNREALLASGRFSGGAKRFLVAQDPSFHFRSVLEAFGVQWAEHVLWYDEGVRQEGLERLVETERLRQERSEHYESYMTQAGQPPA